MSYSTDLKEELLGSAIKNNCCRKAFIYGILLGIVNNGDPVRTTESPPALFRSSSATNAEKVAALLTAHFKIPFYVASKKLCGREEYSVLTAERNKSILSISEAIGSNTDAEDLGIFRCGGCRQAFARGMFVSSATMSDPRREFHLEFSSKNATVLNMIRSFLSAAGVAPNGKTRIYYKNAERISEVLAYIGLEKKAFELINLQIEKTIRNDANRVTNCETKNIRKSVDAALLQVEAITYIISEGGFDRLPDELKTTAELRLRNPDIRLADLAALHVPPLTKSGLNHRLTKLVSVADAMKGGSKE